MGSIVTNITNERVAEYLEGQRIAGAGASTERDTLNPPRNELVANDNDIETGLNSMETELEDARENISGKATATPTVIEKLRWDLQGFALNNAKISGGGLSDGGSGLVQIATGFYRIGGKLQHNPLTATVSLSGQPADRYWIYAVKSAASTLPTFTFLPTGEGTGNQLAHLDSYATNGINCYLGAVDWDGVSSLASFNDFKHRGFYDSGWVSLAAGANTTLVHALGFNPLIEPFVALAVVSSEDKDDLNYNPPFLSAINWFETGITPSPPTVGPFIQRAGTETLKLQAGGTASLGMLTSISTDTASHHWDDSASSWSNKNLALRTKGGFTTGLILREPADYLIHGSIYAFNSMQCGVSSGNVGGGALIVEYFAGEDNAGNDLWTAVSNLYDGTESGGDGLSRDGVIRWDWPEEFAQLDPTGSAGVKYWYRLRLTSTPSTSPNLDFLLGNAGDRKNIGTSDIRVIIKRLR